MSQIIPADVLARVQLISDELDTIREVLNKSKIEQPPLRVQGAEPREVFFQALTMLRKSNRLAFEHTGYIKKEPEIPDTFGIRPFHVFNMVNTALDRIQLVKRELAINRQSREKIQPESTTPSDVFSAIVQVNRQINLMLKQKFEPSDVYQEVSLGIFYATKLTEALPLRAQLLETPTFEKGKTPFDVYRKLIDCFNHINAITSSASLKVLSIEQGGLNIETADPSDVYDIASLNTSELVYLFSLVRSGDQKPRVYYPGKKTPSNVFYRAQILEKKLLHIREYVRKHPTWLRQVQSWR